MKNKARFGLIVFISFIYGCTGTPSMEYIGPVSQVFNISYPEVRGDGAQAPDFTWINEEGEEVTFSEYSKDKIVMVNFWASWCSACKMTLPALRSVGIEYADSGVVVLGILTHEDSMNPDYKLDYISRFVSDRELGYPTILDPDDRLLKEAFGIKTSGVPVTVIVGRDGRIIKSFSGSRSFAGLAEEIDRLL